MRGRRGYKGLLKTLFRGGLGVRLAISHGERGLVFGERFFALGSHIVEEAQVDVRPGERAGVFGGAESGLKVSNGGSRLALHKIDASENVVGVGMVRARIGESCVSEVGRCDQVALEKIKLSKVKADRFGRDATKDIMAAFGQESDLLVAVALATPSSKFSTML